MQRVRYREVIQIGEGAGHVLRWEGKYISARLAQTPLHRACAAGWFTEEFHARFTTWFASHLFQRGRRLAPGRQSPLADPHSSASSRPFATPAGRPGRSRESSKPARRRRGQGPPRAAPERHQEANRKTLRAGLAVKSRNREDRLHRRPLLGHGKKGR